MDSLKDRIEKLMESTGWSHTRVAAEAKVSKASVTHWLNGSTKELKGPTAANLSKNSRFNAKWLINGVGQMMVDAAGSPPNLDEETQRFTHAYGYLLRTIPAPQRATAHGQAVQVLLQLLQEYESQAGLGSKEAGKLPDGPTL